MNNKTITTLIVIFIFFLMIFSFFIEPIFSNEFLEDFKILAYGAIIILIIMSLISIILIKKFFSKKSKLKQNNQKTNVVLKEDKTKKINQNKELLEKQRNEIIDELKSIENQFLKNKISKDTFNKISQEKNTKLIKIEAELDTNKKGNMDFIDAKALEEISIEKKNILKGLLEEKQRKVYELQLTQKSFLKRKIDEQTYKKITDEVKTEIISIETKIKSLQKEEELAKMKKQLTDGAKEILKQQKNTKKRVQEQPKTFEDQVFEQIGLK